MESKKYKTSCLIWVLIMGLVFPEIVMGQRNENHDTNGNRPNIIFILTDDQRWDALGYAGNEHIKTPEMDKLARAGAYFRHAFSSTPICSASRASIFTGLYECTHKYTFQTTEILEEYMQKSYPALLNEAGYFTGFFGKFGINYNKKDQLFDRIEDYDRNNRYDDYRGYYYKQLDHDTVHLTRYTGARALAFIDSIPDNQPFCLSLSFSAPHAHDKAAEQYFWQEACDHLYRDVQMPGPDLAGPEWFNQLPDLVQNGFNRTRWHWRYDTPEKYQHSIKGYYRMIYGVDREIGKIRKKLKKRGMDQNTVIILMGDNGYFMGERQLAGKWLMYENSLRVPLVVYDPRLKTSTDIHDMALNIDIPSTIIDLAGIDQPPSWHGKSLMPIISGPTNSLQRDTILIEHLWEFESIPPSEGVRTDEWKYFRYVNNKSLEELYHLTSDPQETNNLADNEKYREQLSVLRQKTNQLSQKYSDPYSGVPTGLTIENIRDPEDKVAIVDEKPEFGWIVPDEAHFQKAYQILVATEKELIDYNIGDVWDTGTVKSNKSVDVEFEGTPLNPHTKYFWKVRIYDQDNRLSGYSKVQSFKTGSFEEEHLTSENYFQKEKIRPTGFRQDTDSAFFIDFGKAAFGTLLLNYSPKENDTLTIRLGEKLLNGNIDRKPGGSIRFQEVKQEVKPGKTRYRISLEADPRNTNEKA
ncbi:MAG: sulfatase, partial [Bacteroidota bacterium]